MLFHEFKTEEHFVNAALRKVTRIIHDNSGVVRIGLSGGATPLPLYRALSEQTGLAFSRIEFYMVDERYVPADHEHSNQKMIRETLIEPHLHHLGGFHYFDTSLPIEASLAKYEKELDDIPNQELDLIILGMGTDGHIASLFPGSDALTEKYHCTAKSETDHHPVHDRLTMTYPIIMKAKSLLLLTKGNEKKKVLDTMFKSNKSMAELPAEKLEEHNNLAIFHLNEDSGEGEVVKKKHKPSRSNLVILDFDDTLFNTKKFVNAMKKLFWNEYGINENEFMKARNEVKAMNSVIDIDNFVERFEVKIRHPLHDKIVNLITQHAKEWIFDDVRGFMKRFSGQHDFVIVNQGDQELQSKRISKSSLPGDIFVHISTDSRTDTLREFVGKYEKVLFVDDKLKNIEEVKKEFPSIETYFISRPEDAPYKNACPACAEGDKHIHSLNDIQ